MEDKLTSLLESFMAIEDRIESVGYMGDDELKDLLKAKNGLAQTYLTELSCHIRTMRDPVNDKPLHDLLRAYHYIGISFFAGMGVQVIDLGEQRESGICPFADGTGCRPDHIGKTKQ